MSRAGECESWPEEDEKGLGGGEDGGSEAGGKKKMVKEDTRLGLGPMTDGPVDVQLRWANLRTREHHVRGQKKSPRKMVVRRLILRKGEEAKRTTTFSVKRKRSM